MSLILATSTAGPSSTGPGVQLVLYREHPFNAILPAATGDNSIALGSGAQTLFVAPNSIAIGLHSVARHPGALVHASGRFASSGDIQAGQYLMRTHTTGIYPTELFFDGTNGSERLEIPDDSTWTFSIMITAHRQDETDGHAGYRFDGVITRGAGADTTTFQGIPVKTVLAESNASWDININADPTQGALRLVATGEPSKIIRWAARIDTLEVTN